MDVTHQSDTMSQPSAARAGTTVRLRVQVYDAIASSIGLAKVTHQARRHGIHRSTMIRLRGGLEPSLAVAMRIAEDLGAPVEALFERVEHAERAEAA